jgi:hypothetical protein
MTTQDDPKPFGDAMWFRLSQVGGRRPVFALIDDEEFQRVGLTNWSMNIAGYATACSIKFLAKHHSLMHRFIIKAERGQIVDHINGDPLDNRKQNLRIVTASQNAMNAKRPTIPGKLSRFKGVTWDRKTGEWIAYITAEKQQYYLGRYETELDAARAYDSEALVRHGAYARTNEAMKLFELDDPFVQDVSAGPRTGLGPHYTIDQEFSVTVKSRKARMRKHDRALTRRLIEEFGLDI